MKECIGTSQRYIKKNLDFACGNPISIKTLSQDEENETRPSGITKEEKMQNEEPQIFEGGG